MHNHPFGLDSAAACYIDLLTNTTCAECPMTKTQETKFYPDPPLLDSDRRSLRTSQLNAAAQASATPFFGR